MNADSSTRPLHALTVFFAALAVSGRLAAQAPKGGTPELPPTGRPASNDYQVFNLKNGSAQDIAQVLAGVFGNARSQTIRVVAEPVSNTLLVAAPAEEIAKIRELIVKLDTPRPDAQAGRLQLKVFPLRFIPADKAILDALKLVVSNNNYSADARTNAVIVNADELTLKTVEALLARLDEPARPQPSADVMVRVVWLVSGPADAAAPPDDLKEILPTLAKLGIDKPRLAAQTLVNVSPNAEFRATGIAKLDGPCQFSVTGRYEEAKDAPKLQVTIRAARAGGPFGAPGMPGAPGVGPGGGRFGGGGMGGPPGAGQEEIGHVQTAISAPPGHLVVLGVTPTDAMTSVFVVQVLRNQSKPAK